MTDPSADRGVGAQVHHKLELRRELDVMVLYVSIVILAALALLPSDFAVTGEGEDHRHVLLAVVWGSAIGLALAHWFAFELAAVGFRGGKVLREDLEIGAVQIAGAALVALATSVPILLSDPDSAVRAAAFVPAVLIGAAGYGAARAAGRSWVMALVFGLTALVVGLSIAAVKAWLTGH